MSPSGQRRDAAGEGGMFDKNVPVEPHVPEDRPDRHCGGSQPRQQAALARPSKAMAPVLVLDPGGLH